MIPTVHLFWACLFSVFFVLDAASAQEMRNLSILTGQTGSTYHRIGQDIARIVRQECGADLQVKSSVGSMENMRRLRQEEFTQLAIVQQDILDYIQVASKVDPTTQDMIRRIRSVFPLYAEEVHLVTTKDSGITSLSDLKGRSVSIGALESGTFLTAKMILWLTKTSVKEVALDETSALSRLLLPDGSPDKVDAMFYVVGKPVTLFAGAPSATDRLAMVPITETPVLRKYERTTITSKDYAWLKKDVDTVKVDSVLMTFDYQNNNCQNVGMVANRIVANLEDLQQKLGHPKWREVKLDASVAGWEPYGCVTKYKAVPVISRSGGQLCRFSNGPAAKLAPEKASPQRLGEEGQSDACKTARDVKNPLFERFCKDFGNLRQ